MWVYEGRALSQSIATADKRRSVRYRIDPGRLAWGVLLVAFALFCVICIITILGIDYFLFQSTVPLPSTLSVGLGTMSVTDLANPTERVGRTGLGLPRGVIVATDPTQQGTIRFTDDSDQLFASVTLHRSSSVTLLEAAGPRFSWSRSGYEIAMDNVVGKVDVNVPGTGDQSIRINARTPAGAIVNFEGAGKYIIEAASAQLRVFNREGSANIISPDLQIGRDIPVGGLGVVNYSDSSVGLRAGYIDLILDKEFESTQNFDSTTGLDSVWVCGHDPGDNPAGSYEMGVFDGSLALRFLRSNDAITHGRTSCVQSFGQSGIDISEDDYNYLTVRTTFYVDYQSLEACGTEGSECPLMLRMDYIDADGEAQKWYHGFYAREQSAYPLRCSTCAQDHDRINEKAWFTYESPNLLSFFKPEAGEIGAEDLTPRTIVALWIYASGHQFDVRIDEAALVAAHLENETIPPG